VSTRIAIGLIVVLFSACAQERAAEPSSTSNKSAKKARAADSTVPASPWEVFKNFAVEPGKTYSLDSTLDFTSANAVAVTLRTSNNSAADLSTLTLYGYWSVPDADHYNPAENRLGADFLYANAGGAIFQVHGSQFRLVLRNDSDHVLVIQELIIFSRSR
jgi:hypothetical protein